MGKQKYLCIQRSSAGGECKMPSPSQMEEMFAKFNAWKEKFKDNIIDMGGKLGGGMVVNSEGATDGPFVEVKEVAGGYMIVEADSLEEAVQVARESPGVGHARVNGRNQGDLNVLTAPTLVEHFFRYEYGRLVSSLTRRLGLKHLEEVEDAVQFALIRALEVWTIKGLPDNPSAWLFRAANNHVVGELRKQHRRLRILEQHVASERALSSVELEQSEDDFADNLLRMLFICCDDSIPQDSQIVFALKTLCGFDVREISIRLFTSEESIYKRLNRAKKRLQSQNLNIDELSEDECKTRLPGVNKILYLLFTEGYLSSNVESAIRRELCDEAIRLATILADHPIGQSPGTFALLALMPSAFVAILDEAR